MAAGSKPSALSSSCSAERSEAAVDSSRSSGGVVAASLIPHIGKLISLISKNEIRYEGVLHDINGPCLGLRDVCVVGSEGGLALEVFQYMLFWTRDIKHLEVKSSSLPSPSYVHGDTFKNQPYQESSSSLCSSGVGVFPHLNLQEVEYGLEKPSFQGQAFHNSQSVLPSSPLNLTSKECNLFESNAIHANTSPLLSSPPPQDPVSYKEPLPLKEQAPHMMNEDTTSDDSSSVPFRPDIQRRSWLVLPC